MSVSETVARPVRTASQLTVAGIIVEFIDAFHLFDFDERQYAVALALLTVVLSWVQTLVENKVGVGFLRKPGGGLDPNPYPGPFKPAP